MSDNPSTKKFTRQFRVYWQDTDAGGIVYHPNYLNFAQKARSDFMRDVVCQESDVHHRFGVLLVVRRAEVDYLASAKLDDLLDVSVEIVDMGNSSITIKQTISCQSRLLANVTIIVVAISEIGRAVRLPPQLRQIFGVLL